ncbi:MAG: hypothetical protein E6K76_00280 [Candidatus Eisenbacteria bacterium]|uniref:Aminoglycoside phosphotransferase domain-containing protein n=1 Tax=Eiseniibacteriota bacterium TaxID=2212470 RepID=A0A538TBD1_UNCEI|nr:MAG: hypothetical protein E6K76_00280 [Candidatus Eisenbacteria bacterium]
MIDAPPFLAPESALHLLRNACADSSWRVREVLEAEIVKEQPGRRRTLRYRVVAERNGCAAREVSWFAKHYRGSRGKRVFWLLRSLGALAPEVLAPEPIGFSPMLKLLVMSALEGSSLSETLGRSGDADSSVERAGRALALVHGAEIPQRAEYLKAHGPREEIVVLEEARRRASDSPLPTQWVCRFMELCSLVEDELARCEDQERGQALLHRDFHPGQVILPGDGIGEVGVLDWDDAALGESELDLGNLEAHLLLDDLQRRGSIRTAPRLIGALHSGYLARGGISFLRLATYRRAALLRLATLERLADPRISVLDWAELASALTEAAST